MFLCCCLALCRTHELCVPPLWYSFLLHVSAIFGSTFLDILFYLFVAVNFVFIYSYAILREGKRDKNAEGIAARMKAVLAKQQRGPHPTAPPPPPPPPPGAVQAVAAAATVKVSSVPENGGSLQLSHEVDDNATVDLQNVSWSVCPHIPCRSYFGLFKV